MAQGTMQVTAMVAVCRAVTFTDKSVRARGVWPSRASTNGVPWHGGMGSSGTTPGPSLDSHTAGSARPSGSVGESVSPDRLRGHQPPIQYLLFASYRPITCNRQVAGERGCAGEDDGLTARS